jgi:hypothetical protein
MTARALSAHDLRAEKALEDAIKKSKPAADRWRAIATVNEAFCNGNQWGGTTYRNGTRQVDQEKWFDSDGVPRIYVNRMQNLNLTLASLLTRDRPTVKAVPSTGEPEDTFRAQVTDKVIKRLTEELDTAQKVHKTVVYAGQGGSAGIKILYDAKRDKVSWANVTIFDYFLDPRCEDYQASPYLIFLDYRDPAEALALWQAAGWEDGEPSTSKYKDAAGDEQEGVVSYELWLKPCREWPAGLYACFVDGKIVERMDFPYTFQDDSGQPEYLYPFVMMKMRDVRGCSYGGTNLTDCVPLNEVNSRIVKMLRLTSNVIGKIPRQNDDAFKPQSDMWFQFGKDDAPLAGAIGYVEPFKIPPVLFTEREYYEAQMNEVVGLNAITTGNKTRSISGRAIENIVELDAQKNADATKSLQDMIKAAWHLTVRLIQRYYTVPRKMRMVDGDEVSVLSFTGADIHGVDVTLEPASELDAYSDVRQAKADERAVQGLPPEGQQQGQELHDAMAADFAETTIESFLAGEPVDLEPEDTNLDVFLDVLERYLSRAAASNDRDTWTRLTEWKRELRRLRAQAAQAQARAPAVEMAPAPGAEQQPGVM